MLFQCLRCYSEKWFYAYHGWVGNTDNAIAWKFDLHFGIEKLWREHPGHYVTEAPHFRDAAQVEGSQVELTARPDAEKGYYFDIITDEIARKE